MKTPDYVLMEDYEYWATPRDKRKLPAGTFVRPIELDYVPKHVKQENPHFNAKDYLYAYTRYGILVLPKDKVRQV